MLILLQNQESEDDPIESDDDNQIALDRDEDIEYTAPPPPPQAQQPSQPHRGYQQPHQQRFMVGGRSGGGGPALGPSDERLKRDIVQVGVSASGVGLFHWRYLPGFGLDSESLFEGTTAQSLLAIGRTDAVAAAEGDGLISGYWMVDYAALPDVSFGIVA